MTTTKAGRYNEILLSPTGALLPNTSVTVRLPGTTTPATLYTDENKGTTAANPTTTDSFGNLSFWADWDTHYDLLANGTTIEDVAVTPSLAALSGSLVVAAGAKAITADLTALGTQALDANTTGIDNTAIGAQALGANTTGEYNTAVGFYAMNLNVGGNRNTAVGYAAMEENVSGSNNTAVGWIALSHNTTGGSNTAIGDKTLTFNTTGSHGVAVGREALRFTVNQDRNVAVGVQALYSLRGGADNTAVGTSALTPGLTEVAAGSNGVNTSTFAGAGVLNVISTTGFPPSGPLYVVTANTVTELSYTGLTATTFTGVTQVAGGGVLTTGASVFIYTASRNTAVGSSAGQASAVQHNDATAIGFAAKADGHYATALGSGASAGADGAVAIGKDSAGTSASTTTQNEIKMGTALHTVNVPGALNADIGDISSQSPTGAKAITVPRKAPLVTVGLLASGRLQFVAVHLRAGQSLTSITWMGGAQALVTGSNQWFALYSAARAKLAVTADDGATAWAANTAKTLTIAGGPYVVPTSGLYYVGICVVATTPPDQVAVTGRVDVNDLPPVLSGASNSGLTNPASAPATANTLTATAYVPLAWVA